MPEPDAPPEAAYENLPLDDLVLDPTNPRFAEAPLLDTDEHPELAHLLRHSNLPDLMKSIASQGFFPGEPIMVVRDERTAKYVVVEGNRRVAACLLLSYPERAPVDMGRSALGVAEAARHRPASVPSLIFKAEADIHRYLGYRHISGVQEWSPLAKALYLRRQFAEAANGARTEAQRLDIVGDRIGATGTYAARLMTSLAIYELARDRSFFDLEIESTSISFSLITVAITRRPINQYLKLKSSKDYSLAGLDEEALKNLFDWMFVRIDKKTVLGDSRNVGKLADVLSDSSGDAKTLLMETRDLEAAWKSTLSVVDETADLLEDALLNIEDVRSILENEARLLSPAEMTKLAEIISSCRQIIAMSTSVPAPR